VVEGLTDTRGVLEVLEPLVDRIGVYRKEKNAKSWRSKIKDKKSRI